MLIDILIFFIGASLLLYTLLGGSDYGAGILELLPAGKSRDARKHVINEAMGPVWEANHMWLILIVVILFMGFPVIFTTLMVALHIPMLALLLGIVVRGAAFTFRHYDAVQDAWSQRIYTWLFGASSLWTAVWLGIIVASLNRGVINARATNAWDAYVAPWWGLYPLSVGVFVAALFVFLACIYLISETEDPVLVRRFTRHAAFFNGLAIMAGGVVFVVSLGERVSLFTGFIRHPLTFVAMGLATLLFGALWFSVKGRRGWVTRLIAGGQVGLILTGWLLLYAPNVMITADGPLSFHEQAAPRATLVQLVLALLAGSLFIFPSLYYLLRIFKLGGVERRGPHA